MNSSKSLVDNPNCIHLCSRYIVLSPQSVVCCLLSQSVVYCLLCVVCCLLSVVCCHSLLSSINSPKSIVVDKTYSLLSHVFSSQFIFFDLSTSIVHSLNLIVFTVMGLQPMVFSPVSSVLGPQSSVLSSQSSILSSQFLSLSPQSSVLSPYLSVLSPNS